MVKIFNPKTNRLLDDLISNDDVISLLALLQNHHKESYEHSLRVGSCCIDLGYYFDIKEENIRIIGYAGLLHDIGKVSIDKDILCKPAELDQKERKIIQTHPRLGFIYLTSEEFQDVKKVVVSHHEYKEQPYPRSGQDRRNDSRDSDRRNNHQKITYLAQLLAIVDVYDALANRRAYKPPLEKDQIITIMKEQFRGDKDYLESFLEII